MKLLAIAVSGLMGLSVPGTLDNPAGSLTAYFPETKVLEASTEKRPVGPKKVKSTLGPAISAGSYVVLDVASGNILTSRKPSSVKPVASLTKLLTALTVIDNASLEEEAVAGREILAAQVAGADVELEEGERLLVRDLLAALLIPSANDAAVVLAKHVGGSEEDFAEMMNKKASELNLKHTHVTNATGLDDRAHFSSAYDMAELLSETWRDSVLGVYLRAESMDISSVDGQIKHHLKTTNRLLGSRTDILAGKTGFTDEAGESLAVVAENEEGYPVIAVLLDSDDRFKDMDNLIDWTFWAYQWPKEESE